MADELKDFQKVVLKTILVATGQELVISKCNKWDKGGSILQEASRILQTSFPVHPLNVLQCGFQTFQRGFVDNLEDIQPEASVISRGSDEERKNYDGKKA